jgi:acetoacetyl-CoA synthetase
MEKPLWTPSAGRAGNSAMKRFIEFVNERYELRCSTYEELYQWSITHIPDFWAGMWEFGGIIASRGYDTIVDDLNKMPGARWFVGSRLNFAENLLRYRDEEIALIFKCEGRDTIKIIYKDLYQRVARLSAALKGQGVEKGDRVAGFMPNMPETVIAMLAATSIGAVWLSCSPDFGIKGVLDRFGRIEPKILFTADGYSFGGRKFDSLERIRSVLGELPGIRKLIVVPHTAKEPDISDLPNAVLYADFLAKETDRPLEFEQVPFEHPLYIMYSSGTTGPPKCMVQSVGGILINHLKELMLHTDVTRRDTIFYYTTCGWMMWNWLVSSLSLGARVLLYDGSAMYPEPGALWKLAGDEKITIFGTSARYLAVQEMEGVKPAREYDLSQAPVLYASGYCCATLMNLSSTSRKASTTVGSNWVHLFFTMIETASSWEKDGL